MLKNKEKNFLRRYASLNNINKYIIGKDVLKDTVFELLNSALEANELIKVSILKAADIDVKEAKEILISNLSCEVVQIIGRCLILYRYSKRNNKITKLMLADER